MAATGSTALKAIFVTGAIPTQADFAAFIESSPNIVDGNLLINSDTNVIAVDPPDLSTGYQLTARYSSCATDAPDLSGVLFPSALEGREGVFYNNTANSISLMCIGGDVLDDTDENQLLVVLPGQIVYFVAFVDAKWNFIVRDNYLGANEYHGLDNNITDVTPSNPGTAYILKCALNVVITSHSVVGASKLPAAVKGRVLKVSNLGAYATHVYRAGSDTFVSFWDTTLVQIEPGDMAVFTCLDSGKWYVTISKALDVSPSYERYYGLISQTGTSAPSVVMDHTDMGNPVWTRTGVGVYRMTLTNAFLGNTFPFIGNNSMGFNITIQKISDDVVEVRVIDNSDVPTDGVLSSTPVYIKNFIET